MINDDPPGVSQVLLRLYHGSGTRWRAFIERGWFRPPITEEVCRELSKQLEAVPGILDAYERKTVGKTDRCGRLR